MKKIISLFQRNYETDRLVRDEVVPGAEWVILGEGIATEKIDGTSCLIQDGKFFKRYDLKRGRKSPQGFIPAQDPDSITGHHPGWLEVDPNKPEDKWHIEGLKNSNRDDGTYELIGPKVQSNPYKLTTHKLEKHGDRLLSDNPRTFESIREFLNHNLIEGIVWHHPDGRMVKIKRKDFGFKWPKP